VYKLIISLHSKRYRQSGILIHQQNSYAPRSRRCTGRREAQNPEPVNKVKKNFLHIVHHENIGRMEYELSYAQVLLFDLVSALHERSAARSSGEVVAAALWEDDILTNPCTPYDPYLSYSERGQIQFAFC
jgi:hypothetical protein